MDLDRQLACFVTVLFSKYLMRIEHFLYARNCERSVKLDLSVEITNMCKVSHKNSR